MSASLAQVILSILLGAVYLPVIFFAIQRRDEGQGAATWLVILYALLAMVINFTEAVWQNSEDPLLLQEVQIYISFGLAVVLMLTLQSFLKSELWWAWLVFLGVWALGLALILTNALDLPDTLWTNGELVLYRSRLGTAWTILGWIGLSIAVIINLSNAQRQSRQPLLRGRLAYWWGPVILTLLSDILLFADVLVAGQPLRWLVVTGMAYVVGTHYVPDLKAITRRVLIYILSTLAIVGFYAAGFLIVQALFGANENFNPLLAGAVVALLIALIFTPLNALISRAITKWMKGDQYDASLTIHQYSESISNILEMDRLSSVAIGIMLEAMQIDRGFLFLVDGERQADGHRNYKIRSARSPEERQLVAAELDENGIIASYFIREQKPLLQYDLDLHPAFRASSPLERNWFYELRCEVYIPIFAKKQWIGMLAFGSKLSGNRYTREDLSVLSAHANQTAVALENARLVDNLMRLNQELRQARRTLEKNNLELQRIDQAKSDFISIASHELRTPLTVIKGYTEMLIEDPKLEKGQKSMMKGIHDGTMRLHEVMDSMFDIAQLDARSLIPHLQPVDLAQLIRDASIEHGRVIRDRQQYLTIKLPALPLVKADAHLLRKIFHHLIRNAVKFTPDNGWITVSGKYIPAIVNLPNGGVEIIVSDTGVGVDPNLRETIFTKFYQPGELGKHSTSKSRFKGGGAGLGLALSKGIVEAHGGRIWVESPGYDEVNFPGSQFHIILPLSKLEAGETHKTSEPVNLESGTSAAPAG
ncbi:MAG: GAF domain-containing protein [Anaerolineales bacterium]|jgi:signal transduction histidine kinase|nr:GAF domain-containing protein [Chloroflexota bacterium]MBK6647872.1 GAF domain-containing protein [Anaerolineales bacterium]MCC6986603.1 GAF domain-containing protein [Anaerolineales bacterium]